MTRVLASPEEGDEIKDVRVSYLKINTPDISRHPPSGKIACEAGAE